MYKEIYSATLDRFKSSLAVPDTGTPFIDNIDLESNEIDNSSNVSCHTTVHTSGADYRGVKRRTIAALRWADVQEKMGWTAVILGDALPKT